MGGGDVPRVDHAVRLRGCVAHGEGHAPSLARSPGISGSAAIADKPRALRGRAYYKGVVTTLREIAAHLGQGDYLPGGTLYEYMTSEWGQ